MKTKILSIFATALIGLASTSCVDLDTAPLAQKSDGTMWQTEKDAEQGVSILYSYLPEAIMQNDDDVYTDNAVHGIKWAVGQQAHGIWDPNDYSWSNEYTYIRYANLVFANIDRVENLSQESRNGILGQAYFFRGAIYFDLIRKFGDVPYIDQPLQLSDQKDITRMNWKEVYDKLMADFDNAIKMLPEYTNDGRVNKMVALGYKARAALYFANPECPHYVSDGWKVAEECSKQIINSGHYALFDGDYAGTAADYTGKYQEMFWDLNIDKSRESLLTRYSIAGINGSYFIGFEAFPKLGWGGTNPTQSFVDCFEDCEGAPISKSKIYDPLKPEQNRDPRLAANVLFSGQELYGVKCVTTPLPSSGDRALYPKGCSDATLTGYQAKKWLNPDVYPETDGWDHSIASSCLRYTEVLLTYAEAVNEQRGPVQEAFDAVNKVRARVGMPALQNTDPSKPTYCASKEDLRERIRNEWRVEFAFEGDHRQWDARRWNIATDVLNAPRYSYKYQLRKDPANALDGDDGWVCDLYVGEANQIQDQIIVYSKHNYVYPIPQTDIDLNSNLKQNEGYLK